jgi:hypothetical protein
LVAGLFAFYLNFVPVHLATEVHAGGLLDSVADTVFHHLHPHGDHHVPEQHTPHPASDHVMIAMAQTHSPAVLVAVICLLADTSVIIEAPQHQPTIPVVERIKPPGESPPDPLLPRAPPLA